MVTEQLDKLIANNKYLKDSKGNIYYDVSHTWHEVKAFLVKDYSLYKHPIELHEGIYSTLTELNIGDYTCATWSFHPREIFYVIERFTSEIADRTICYVLYKIKTNNIIDYLKIKQIPGFRNEITMVRICNDIWEAIDYVQKPVMTIEIYNKYKNELNNMVKQ